MQLYLKRVIYIFLLIIWAEIVSFIALTVIGKRFPNAVYNPSFKYNLETSRSNLSDPIGWGSSTIQISSENYKTNCKVYLFGDSFMEANTYENILFEGNQYSPEDLLSKKTGCFVINYGVGGYGSDQAYLKFISKLEINEIKKGDFVVLSHLTENILRNANRNRKILYYEDDMTPLIKPVFRLNGKNLEKIPLPKLLTEKDIKEIIIKGYSSKVIEGENKLFIPSKALGSPVFIKFPYTINLVKSFFSWHIFPRYFGKQRFSPFYNSDSNAFKVTKEIILDFHRKCKEYGCIPISIDLPIAADFKSYFKNSEENHFPLYKSLSRSGVDHFSLGQQMVETFPKIGKNHCLLHDGYIDGGTDGCNGHFNNKGYKTFIIYMADLINSRK